MDGTIRKRMRRKERIGFFMFKGYLLIIDIWWKSK